MLLHDNINIRIDFDNLNFPNYRQGLKFIIFQLTVLNYDSEKALVNLSYQLQGQSSVDIYEFEEFKIQHELTAKKWIALMCYHHFKNINIDLNKNHIHAMFTKEDRKVFQTALLDKLQIYKSQHNISSF
jgi:hypothetical protein